MKLEPGKYQSEKCRCDAEYPDETPACGYCETRASIRERAYQFNKKGGAQ